MRYTAIVSAGVDNPSATMVRFDAQPVRVCPCHGELLDLLKPALASYVHFSSGVDK